MDFIEGLPKSEGYNAILVVADRFTKYSHFIPLKHPFTAHHVARVVLDNVVKLHGLPRSIVTDKDRIFLSTFWKELFKLYETKLTMSTAYHPQTDGQTERVNPCLEMYLRCAVQHSPKKWKSWLALAEFWYNTTFHTSLRCSPFKALYGHDPNFGALSDITTATPQLVTDLVAEREAQSLALKEQLAKAQNRMKVQADRHRTNREFHVGDQVLLKLQPYAQVSVVNRPFPKLAYKYFGPYRVLKRIGIAAYQLDLPSDSLVHPVFHVSQLKPFTPDYTPVYADLPKLVDLDAGQLEPERVLDRRLVKKGNCAVPQVLVKWTRLPEASATWEDYYVVQKRFPMALAWGQASSGGGGGVTPVTTIQAT
uniref:Integrase catalytic domain-containing protein n=1 Tax=Arundo donax TaxID=35708 RepID=A0A0A8ZED4_ARUDO